MSLLDPCLIRFRGPSGQVVVRVGMPLVDDYLEFMEGRCRPNTVLAAAYDLRVFFRLVDKTPAEVVAGDVLGFITAHRTGRSGSAGLHPVDDEPGGVAISTVARRLSIPMRSRAEDLATSSAAQASRHRWRWGCGTFREGQDGGLARHVCSRRYLR
jgi:hypothetical protein